MLNGCTELRALAKNCDAPINNKGVSIILKVVKYWPEKGKSGFLVWKYLLRRHDEQPPPWTEEGQQRTARLGLVMQVWVLRVTKLICGEKDTNMSLVIN